VNPKDACSGSLERYNPPLQTYKISRTPQSICSCSSLPKSAKSHFGCLGCLGVKVTLLNINPKNLQLLIPWNYKIITIKDQSFFFGIIFYDDFLHSKIHEN
jgi:hypothetical protein